MPQAWAAAAPLLALRTLLGLEPNGEELRAAPVDDELARSIRLHGVSYRCRRVDVGSGLM